MEPSDTVPPKRYPCPAAFPWAAAEWQPLLPLHHGDRLDCRKLGLGLGCDWPRDLPSSLGLTSAAEPVGHVPIGLKVNHLGLVLCNVLLNSCMSPSVHSGGIQGNEYSSRADADDSLNTSLGGCCNESNLQ